MNEMREDTVQGSEYRKGAWQPIPERDEIGKRVNKKIQSIFKEIEKKSCDRVDFYYMQFYGYKLKFSKGTKMLTVLVRPECTNEDFDDIEQKVEKRAIECLKYYTKEFIFEG